MTLLYPAIGAATVLAAWAAIRHQIRRLRHRHLVDARVSAIASGARRREQEGEAMGTSQSLGEMTRACERFNDTHKVGRKIWVHPGSLDAPAVEATIVMPGAFVLSKHTAVVRVSGGHGCIALDHVAVTP